jgi:hypothetical protein
MGFRDYLVELSESKSNLFGKTVDISADKEAYTAMKKDGLDSPSNKIKYVDRSTIKAGDTIIYDGKVKTVSKNNIGKDDLLGITIFGDSFKNGNEPVKLVLMHKGLHK